MKLLNLILLGAGGLVLYKMVSKKSAPEVPQQPIFYGDQVLINPEDLPEGEGTPIYYLPDGTSIPRPLPEGKDVFQCWQEKHPGETMNPILRIKIEEMFGLRPVPR